VHVTLDGQANDGDPNIDQLDSTAVGEGDNIGTDVENLTGTKRDDRLIGSGVANTLLGDEGVDVLTGGAGEDVILAREPVSAGSGIADTISCGSPAPSTTKTSTFGVFIATTTGNDRLQADLADPKPADCELLVDMAVDEPAPVNIARSARLVPDRRLAVRLTCPRKAKRTCKGELRLAGKKAGSTAAKFSISGGSRRTVRLKLSRRVAKALKRKRALARVVSNETGLEGEVNRVELVRVR
jgi:Ca2+-binding RTX toxin-like protein